MARKPYNVTQRAAVRCRNTKDPGVKAVAMTAWADGYRAACADIRRAIKTSEGTMSGTSQLDKVRQIVNDYNGRLR